MNTPVYNFPIRPCTLVYGALVALTLITWLIGKSGFSGLYVALAVLYLALFKGMLIGDYFMGLKGVRGPWRWAVVIWLVVPGSLITWAFVLAA